MSLNDSIATMITPVELCDTNWITDTNVNAYSCPGWYDYQLLVVQYCYYGNVLETVVVSTDFFNTTSSGKRVLMQEQNLAVYVKDRSSIYIQYSATAQYRKVVIMGVLKK